MGTLLGTRLPQALCSTPPSSISLVSVEGLIKKRQSSILKREWKRKLKRDWKKKLKKKKLRKLVTHSLYEVIYQLLSYMWEAEYLQTMSCDWGSDLPLGCQ